MFSGRLQNLHLKLNWGPHSCYEKLGSDCLDGLLYYNVEMWCKKYFKEHSKCDSVDNNMAESFNSWILSARYKTIITMLEEIRIKMMKRISQL